jgi:hypothetical protein
MRAEILMGSKRIAMALILSAKAEMLIKERLKAALVLLYKKRKTGVQMFKSVQLFTLYFSELHCIIAIYLEKGI